jgi:hypothetical protein
VPEEGQRYGLADVKCLLHDRKISAEASMQVRRLLTSSDGGRSDMRDKALRLAQ